MEYNKYLTALLGNFIIFLIASIMAFEYSFLIASFIIPIGMVISSLLIDSENIVATDRQIYWLLRILAILHFIYCCYAGICIYIYTNSWMGIAIGLVMGYMLGKYSTRQWITPTKSYLKD
jgi:hypothetical protein